MEIEYKKFRVQNKHRGKNHGTHQRKYIKRRNKGTSERGKDRPYGISARHGGIKIGYHKTGGWSNGGIRLRQLYSGRCKMCLGKKKPHTGRFCGAAVAGGRTVYRRDGTVCKSGKRKSFWQFGLFFYAALYRQLL